MDKKFQNFPYEAIYPRTLVQIIEERAKNSGYPIDFTSASFLVCFGVAMGATTEVRFQNDFIESGNLFCVLVGPPNSAKSHPMAFAMRFIRERNRRLIKEYNRQKAEYDRQKGVDEDGNKLTEPVRELIELNDFTVESLMKVLNENPRGIIIFSDELMNFMKNQNKYNSGSSAEAYLTLWSRGSISISRKTSGYFNVERGFASILGSVQTKILPQLFDKTRSDNGMLDRFLFVFPDNLTMSEWVNQAVSSTCEEELEGAFSKLFALPQIITDQGIEPLILEFEPLAKEKLIEWRNGEQHRGRLLDENTETFATAMGKMDIMAIRFSLILQAMYYAFDEEGFDTVGMRAVEGAILLSEYFKEQIVRVHDFVFKEDVRILMNPLQKTVSEHLPNEIFKAEIGQAIAEGLGMDKWKYKRLIADKRFFTKKYSAHYLKNGIDE